MIAKHDTVRTLHSVAASPPQRVDDARNRLDMVKMLRRECNFVPSAPEFPPGHVASSSVPSRAGGSHTEPEAALARAAGAILEPQSAHASAAAASSSSVASANPCGAVPTGLAQAVAARQCMLLLSSASALGGADDVVSEHVRLTLRAVRHWHPLEIQLCDPVSASASTPRPVTAGLTQLPMTGGGGAAAEIEEELRVSARPSGKAYRVVARPSGKAYRVVVRPSGKAYRVVVRPPGSLCSSACKQWDVEQMGDCVVSTNVSC
jgi:hypothetical protein